VIPQHRPGGRSKRLHVLMVVALAALAGVTSLSASASHRALTTFTFGTQGSNYLIDVAKARGFFAKEGIDPQIVNFAAPAAEYAALSGGQVDAILTPPNILLAQDAGRSAGSRYVYFENWAGTDLHIVGSPKANLPSVKSVGFNAAMQALKGKTFGVPAFGGINDILPRQLMKAAGLNPDTDVKFVVVAYGQTARTALQQGTIDAYPFDATFAAPAVADDGDTLIVNGTDPQVPASLRLSTMMFAGYAGVDGVISQKKALYQAVDRAMVRAKAFVANPKNLKWLESFAQTDFNMSATAAKKFGQIGIPLQTQILNCARLGNALSNFIRWGVAKPPLPGCPDLFSQVLTPKQILAIYPGAIVPKTPTKKK